MNYQLSFPSTIDASVSLPASKSISNRALIINALSACPIALQNVAECDDTDAMLNALSSMSTNINIGAAGTTMRFLTAYFAMQVGKTITLDGSERMRHRPIKVLVEALKQIGADIEYVAEEGFPPLRINGKKIGRTSSILLPGNVSSQYISAIMMISPLIEGGLTIELTGDLISVPYIDMTLAIMQKFGAKGTRKENIITIPQGSYDIHSFTIENDWSAASYWYEIVALIPGARITLSGLSNNSLQGDSAIRQYFTQLGVISEFDNSGNIILTNDSTNVVSDKLELNLTNQPDLAQTIIVTACLKDIHFHITGLSTLKIKETDRLLALQNELLKLGYRVEIHNDSEMSWDGAKIEAQAVPIIATYHDHRMAMAFAPAAIQMPLLIIENAEVVTKSYPQFWKELQRIGVTIVEENILK